MTTESKAAAAIVLAAGQGTRMKSARPKVLHEVAGRPMVLWALEAVFEAGASRVVLVVGHGRDEVERVVRARHGDRVTFAVQETQRGTGDAVRTALPALEGVAGSVLVTYGDCPRVRGATLRALEATRADAPLAFLGLELDDPTGYGRVRLDAEGRPSSIVEHKDASPEERAIRLVNSGLYTFELEFLRATLPTLTTDNAQGELYLTDLVAHAAAAGRPGVVVTGSMDELRGVNDPLELAEVEAACRRELVRAAAKRGVRFDDLATAYVDAEVVLEAPCRIGAGVHLRGRTVVCADARIDAGCVLEDVFVGPGAHVRPYTVATDARLGELAEVGPFSHLRPETTLGRKAKVGNFCETKKTTIGDESKVNHLAYVGDGQLGQRVNVGAGTIFCNYDGFLKHTTVLEDDVFIGSDSQLVAPVRVSRGAYVASGTTVTRDVPADALAISRVKQENKEGLAAKLRARGKAAKAAQTAAKAAKAQGDGGH